MRNSSSQTDKIDSLRAGLRIEDVDFKDAYTPKMIDQQNAYWRRIVDVLDDSVNGDRALSNQLRLRRRQVLSGQYTPRHRAGLPQLAMGTAAGVALFAAVAAWWEPAPDAGSPAVSRTASLSSNQAETAAMTQTASLETVSFDQADFANNIDFYTWLEKQSDTVANAGGD